MDQIRGSTVWRIQNRDVYSLAVEIGESYSLEDSDYGKFLADSRQNQLHLQNSDRSQLECDGLETGIVTVW
jgi:hypothetical protein